MPARRKSSAPCVVRALGPSDPEATPDADIFDVEMLRQDSPTDRTEPDAKSHCPRDAHRPDQENLHPEPSEEERSGERGKDAARSERQAPKKESKGYECKCCPFRSPNLTDFQEHVDSSHPNVILNPLYRCAACDFDAKKFELLTEHNDNLHPHESNFKFKRIERNNRTVLEQTIRSQGRPGPEERGGAREASGFPPRFFTAAKTPDPVEGLSERRDGIAALNINGAVIIPEPSVLRDPSSHVTPVLRRPPNYHCQPKIAVPLNSSKYNPSLDHNPTLIASFHKFPYPTHAELSWLTAASKHPEEQIKVWFTTQRLKQGITWSPEEVEEARKKMFNGSVPADHHTFATPAQPRFQSVASTPNPAAGVSAGSAHAPKRSLAAHGGPESKRAGAAVAPGQEDPKDKAPNAPPQPESPAVVPVVTSSLSLSCAKGKLGNPKTKPVVSLPSMVFPESLTRPTIAPPPVFAPPFKSSLLLPRLCRPLPAANVTFPNLPSPVSPAAVRRPPVIRSAATPAKVPAGIAQEEERSDGTGGTLSECSREAAALGMAEGGELPLVDSQRRSPALAQFPLLERMRGKTAEQLKILEEHFLRNVFLSQSDVDRLALAAGLSRREIDGWFAERRALRDNMELALLNSMGAKKTEADKDATLPLNGIRQPGSSAPGGKSGSGPPPRSVQSSHSPALLKERFAQTEGVAALSEVWPGLAGVDVARWFCDRRSTPHAQLFHRGAASGGAGPPEKSAASSPAERCREGGAERLEAQPGWPPHAELQDRLAGRCE
ncbi:zinc fingers and homeoboxes protein 2-like [Hippocampus zosterae]|uniref:zinc fingers and homeoboxes protein 2-like n=1 Tax=Hippocampus zosterae TaxID=109293 RepID=UPI00223D444C|nr:zinc fingers and homeoboxes protein 2-like [Hippocampus zosterae]XP_051925809.1 zinc fingers and homeoboxes protein 2-like [Hippocampus zosterae]